MSAEILSELLYGDGVSGQIWPIKVFAREDGFLNEACGVAGSRSRFAR